jgi:MoaA/NifB/PqqE/SkfB family radical SAM enzyme
MGRFDHSQYVSMTMEFRCNLKCVHCMIEGTMDRLIPETLDKFHELLEYNTKQRRWKGLILTGSEITLRRDLPELARLARQANFERVRIQTHGMHLGQESFTRKLVEAGVNEFFISICGPDAESHDRITEVPHAFERTMRGMEHLEQYEDVVSITNTVVTTENFRLLPAVVERLAHLRNLMQMEFWVYFPMKETDEKNLIASHMEMLPWLREALEKCIQLGREVEVKNFPECLLGEYGYTLENAQPLLFIDDSFWDEFARNGFYQCKYREQCGSKGCLGLNTAYIKKYGWEENHLHPLTQGCPLSRTG